MNRRIRNRSYGGVGGRRGRPRLLPDWAKDNVMRMVTDEVKHRILNLSCSVLMILTVVNSLLLLDAHADCSRQVQHFAARPNELNYVVLVNPATRVIHEECWKEINHEQTWTKSGRKYVSKEVLEKVLEKVSSANKWAALIIASNLGKLDGGDLEDSLVALGVSINKSPSLLLSFYRDGVINKIEFESCCKSTPLDLPESARAHLSYLEKRKRSISSVKTASLQSAKSMALIYIEEAIQVVRNTWPDL